MIKIKREYMPNELSKTNNDFKNAIEGMSTKEAYEFYKRNENKYKYNTKETKKVFKTMNHERCSFCTKHISDFDDEMTIEHIKIKRDYPQEIFQWNNLLCSCRTCNTKRSTSAYDAEKYLDPTQEQLEIEQYFSYKLDGKIVPNEKLNLKEREKARYMIEDLYKLNRNDLVCGRRNFLKKLMEDEEFFECLKKEDKSSQNIIFLSVFAYYYRRCN